MTPPRPSGRYTPPKRRRPPGHEDGFELAIVVDPELALPDDSIPGRRIQVVAMWAPPPRDTFDTIGELIMARTEAERLLNAGTTEAQRDYDTAGTYFYDPLGLHCYGRTFTPGEIRQREVDFGTPTREAMSVERRVADANRRGWLYGWWWSRVDTGEWGAVHRSWVRRAVPAFEYAAAAARMGAQVDPVSRWAQPGESG